MAYKSYPFKTRLDLIKKIEEDSVKVVEDEKGKKVNQAPTTRLDDIAPVRQSYPTTTTTKKTTTSSKKKKDTWFSSGAFSDGYDFGDLTKTILGTTGDVVTGVTKGVFGLGEGIGDAINYGVAGVADALGKDRFADDLRAGASESLTDKIFKPAEEFYDKYSVLGERSDNITQGLGNVAAIIATGGIGASAGLGTVGTTALTTGFMGTSSLGSGMSEAYQGGATDEEAFKYGLISGVAEAGTELIFGGLGRGVNALGLSKGLSSADDMLAKAVSNKFKTQLAKNLSEYTVKAGAEGLEEVMAGLVQGIGKKVTYMSEEELGKILADEQLLDQFIMGAVTSGIAQAPGLIKTTSAGRDYVSGYTQNEQSVIDKEVQNRIGDKKLTNKEISKITDEVKADFEKGYISTDTIESVLGGDTYTQLQSIRDNKTSLEQEISELENKPYAEMTVKENERLKALREELSSVDTNTLENQLQSEMGQKIANDGYLQRSYQEKANRGQNFTYDTTKITNENEKAVYESAAKFMNNTNRSHEFVEKVAKIAKDKGTNYGFINNEELKSLGHNVDGKQVNGLVRTTQDGKQTVLINVDSAKALNTIVGHETTHLLEGTTEYQELQEALFNYAKTKGDFDTRQASLNELYEGIEGADVNSELTADLVGDYLFTDTDFINSLSTQKPTVFQKIKDLIDDLVIRFKGTKEEKQLREVQKKFKEAYKQNVASKETNARYSLISDNANKTYIQESNKNKAIRMKEKGASEQEIWLATGYQYNNGKWQTEVKDPKLKINQILEHSKEYRLEEVVDADELFRAYPELRNRTVSKIDFFEKAETPKEIATVQNLKGAITDDGNICISDTVKSRVQANEILTHEIQHLIQELEGLESNDNTYLMQDKNGEYYFSEDYLADLDEIEARQVQNRANMSEEQRKNILPKNTTTELTRYSLNEMGAINNLNNIEGFQVQEDYYPYDEVIGHSFAVKTKEGEAHLQIRETDKEVYLNMINTRLGKNQPEKGTGTKILNNLKEYSDMTGKKLIIAGEVGSASGFYDKFDWLKKVKGEIYDDNGVLFDIESPNRVYEPNNNDTRYSLSEKGTLQDSNGNDVTLETSKAGSTGTLLAVHSLNEKNLKNILSLGGIPVGSLAITNADKVDVLSEFGGKDDFILMFRSDTIDPKNKLNEVYNRDIYSKTVPQIYQKVDKRALKKVIDEFYPYESEYGSLNKHDYSKSSLESIVNDLSYSTAVKAKFLEDNGYGIKKVYKDFRSGYYSFTAEEIENFKKKYPDLASLNEYSVDTSIADQIREITLDMMAESSPEVSREQYAKLFKEKFYLNDVIKFYRDIKQYDNANKGQEFDSYATRDNIKEAVKEHEEEFNQWLTSKFENLYGDKYFENETGTRKYDYTLENLTSYMKKGKTQAQQKGMFDSFSVGQAKAGAATRYKTLDQIREASKDLVDAETYKERHKAFEEIDDAVRTELGDTRISKGEDLFEVYSDYYMALSKAASGVDAIKALESNYFKDLTPEQINKFSEVAKELANLPAKYFEAKPQRAIGLNEIDTIAVPNTASVTIKQQLINNGFNIVEYDPNIEGDKQRVVEEQDRLKFSLSQQNETVPRNPNLTYGEDVRLAPLQEEIKTLTETVQELKEQIAPVQESPVLTEKSPVISGQEVEYTQPTKAELDNLMTLQETGGTEYANTFFGLRDKYGQRNLYKGINEYKKAPDTYEAPIKGDEFAPITEADLPMLEQQYEEDFRNIDESSMPIETEEFAPTNEVTPTKSLFETRNYEDVGSRKVNAYQYDNPEVKPFFQEEAQAMLGDLKASTKGERQYNDDLYYATGGEQGFYGTQRYTTDDIAELLDGVDGKYKYTYADIEKGLNAIINDKGSENNAVSKRIEFYLDKRLREGYTTVDGIEIPANQDYIDTLIAKDTTDFYNALPVTDDMAPVENVENYVENVSNSKEIAPVKEKYETIKPKAKIEKNELGYIPKDPTKESTYDDIAEVLVEEPKTESDRNKRKWAIFKANVFDKGIVFEDLALKNNNRELMGKWDYTLTSEARGQYVIGNGHNGASKSLNDIRSEVESTGLTKDFYNYMYHKHNVDRMSLATRFEGMENKPVFGESVTAEQSQAIVNQYEKTHPEFLDFAQDVYDYVNADKQVLIDKGVISQETADLWSEMYPHYVPTRRTTDTGIDINVPLDTGRTGINAPIKKATGGSSDILPLFDTMAMRTLQTYRATAKNSFGVELMNTLGTTVESNQTNVDEVIDSIDAQEGLLQEGKKGKKPTFTVFENGEKVTFEITKDMYDALKPLNESSLLSKTVKPLNAIGNLRRGLLTEYNPTFLLTNAIKDTQDILINSQHATKTYSKIPEAHKQLLSKGYWYQEYVANGGERNSYFDNETNSFKTENKGVSKITDLPPLKAISNLNNHIEMIPRLAEYIASREAGRSIEVSMLDAARVTTNFKAGGAVTKWANRNGATFLNASVQGAMQQVRNIREAKANGVKGWVNLATKFAIAGLPAILLNNLIWDDDEEYDDLSDYVKQNYYVIGKTDDGTFIRIPKGRTVAVIQEGINQMSNLITGNDEADLKTFIDLTINNLAPNNPLDNNVLSPIIQVANNEAWYGGDLVPTRLQNLPEAQQYDESTDVLSRWLGEIFDYSPYKINYLIDQYSGGLGDVLLPMMTPEAESGADSLTDQLIAPIKDKFTTSSTFNNQNVTDFYDLKEKLLINSNKENASDKDVLQNKYINSVNGELSELYKQKREIQNSNLSNSEKYKQAKEVQEQINALAKNALSEYTNISSYSNYSTVGDREYYKRINSEGEVEWTKVDNEEAEDLNNLNMTNDDKNVYFATKTEISGIVSKTDDADEKKSGIIDSLLSVDMDDDQKAYLYGKYYSSDETLEKVTDSGISFDDYLTFHKDTLSIEGTEPKVEYLYNSDYTSEAKTVIYETSVLSGFDNEDKYKDYKTAKAAGIDIDSWLSYKKQEFVADKDSSGNSISGSRKDKIISYINSLDLSIPQKAILIRQEYKTYTKYNNQIVSYVGGLDISYEEKVDILEGLDMTVDDDGNVYWD